VFAVHNGGTLGRSVVVTELSERIDELVVVVAPELRALIDRLWNCGWQPVEAVHHVRRGCSAGSVQARSAMDLATRRARSSRSTVDAHGVRRRSRPGTAPAGSRPEQLAPRLVRRRGRAA
jgi:hypothetical protein